MRKLVMIDFWVNMYMVPLLVNERRESIQYKWMLKVAVKTQGRVMTGEKCLKWAPELHPGCESTLPVALSHWVSEEHISCETSILARLLDFEAAVGACALQIERKVNRKRMCSLFRFCFVWNALRIYGNSRMKSMKIGGLSVMHSAFGSSLEAGFGCGWWSLGFGCVLYCQSTHPYNLRSTIYIERMQNSKHCKKKPKS